MIVEEYHTEKYHAYIDDAKVEHDPEKVEAMMKRVGRIVGDSLLRVARAKAKEAEDGEA